jgi:lipopolysaccharide biosynthesis regulator YciM
MAAVISPTKYADELRDLRKKKLWRSLIELGNQMLTQPDQVRAVSVHAEIAKAYIEVKQYDLARKHLTVAQTLRPKNVSVSRRFGELEYAVGNYEAAARHWQSVMRKKKAKRADRSFYLNLAKAQRNLADSMRHAGPPVTDAPAFPKISNLHESFSASHP